MIQRRTALKRSTVPLKRTPLKRTATVLRRTARLPAVSAKRRDENAQRRLVVAQLRERFQYCAAKCVRTCTNTPDDAHEVVTRARGGSITDPANIMLVCRPCHDWITDHPLEAHRLGLVKNSWERS